MICSKDDSGSCCGECFNPVVVIATHQRIELTTKNIKSLLKHKVKVVIVCSLATELEYFKQFDVTVVLHENRPLGMKWQHGVNVARKLNANPLIIMGSDDFLHPNYLEFAFRQLENGYDMIGLTHWITYDKLTNKAYHCEYRAMNVDFPLGSGRVYSKRILDKIRWLLFETKAERKLDDQGFRNVKNLNGKIFLFRQPYVLAYKEGKNELNPARKYLDSNNISFEQVSLETLTVFNVQN